MSLRRLVVPFATIAVASASLVVASAPPAAAEPAWTPPDLLGPSLHYGRGSISGIATNGEGTTVLRTATGSYVRRPSGGWDVDPYYSDPTVVDADGTMWGAGIEHGSCYDDENWSRYEDFKIFVVHQRRGGPEVREPIEGSWAGCTEGQPELAAHGAGAVTAVWAGGSSLLAARRSGGGGWSKPTEVAPLDGHAEYELLAGRDGRTTVLWGAANGLMASTSTKLGEWSAPSLVAPAGSENARISDVTVADDPSGNLVAVWLESTGTDQELAVRIGSVRRPAGEAWRGQRTLATTTGVVTKNLDLAVNRGGATVAWFQGNSDNTAGSVMTLSRSEQGWPARPTVLDDSLTAWTEPSLAAAAEDVMAVWSSGPDSGAYPVAARRSPSGRWGTPRPLATPKAAATHPRYYEAERSPLVVVPRSNMFTVVYQGSPNIKFRDYVDDRTPPSARIVPFADPYLHPAYDDVDFSVRDDQTGARNYDVRMRYVKRNGRLTNWALIARRTREATTYLEDPLPGRTYCFSVRARDRAGNLGPWSRSRCNTAAKDDRAASTTPGWTRTADRDAFRASLTTTRRHGQSLTLRGVTARRISLMARTCSSCGAVTVHHAGRYLGRLSLSTRSVQVSRVFPLRRYAKERTGPLVIRVVSRGKPVHIDGFIPRR